MWNRGIGRLTVYLQKSIVVVVWLSEFLICIGIVCYLFRKANCLALESCTITCLVCYSAVAYSVRGTRPFKRRHCNDFDRRITKAEDSTVFLGCSSNVHQIISTVGALPVTAYVRLRYDCEVFPANRNLCGLLLLQYYCWMIL